MPTRPLLERASDGKPITVADVGGNVYLIESSNGTFAPATITTRTLTYYTDATITAGDSTSTQSRTAAEVTPSPDPWPDERDVRNRPINRRLRPTDCGDEARCRPAG